MNDRPAYDVPFADGAVLQLGRQTRVMGVLNVTPDSFSDGGRYFDLAAALDLASRMVDAGVDIIDVGGESTRPGARAVSVAQETHRVLPVIEAIKRELGARVSVDTMKADVARQAVQAGADMINDVSGFGDPGMLSVARKSGAPVVAMHMRGTPRTMQRRTDYDDLVATVAGFLEDCVGSAIAAGVSDDKIIVDPGIGFGKSAAGSMRILKHLPEFRRLRRPILIGASRKSFIGRALDLPVDERLEGSLAVAAYASAQGAHVVRTHDVGATVRVVRMIDAIRQS